MRLGRPSRVSRESLRRLRKRELGGMKEIG